MYNLIIDYGMVAIGLFLSGLTAIVVKHGLALIDSKIAREYSERGWHSAAAAVRFVLGTYVDELKLANADGKLTAAEKKEAKARAIAAAKSYIGAKGLKEIAKVFDVEEWLGAKIEAVVSDEKRLGKLQLQPPAPAQ